MNIEEYMAKRQLTDKDLEEMAAPYERGDFADDDGTVYKGSHLNAVGTKRVTVVYPSEATQQVASLARERGVKPSDIYRDALKHYLTSA